MKSLPTRLARLETAQRFNSTCRVPVAAGLLTAAEEEVHHELCRVASFGLRYELQGGSWHLEVWALLARLESCTATDADFGLLFHEDTATTGVFPSISEIEARCIAAVNSTEPTHGPT